MIGCPQPQPKVGWNSSIFQALWDCKISCRTMISSRSMFHQAGARAEKALAKVKQMGQGQPANADLGHIWGVAVPQIFLPLAA